MSVLDIRHDEAFDKLLEQGPLADRLRGIERKLTDLSTSHEETIYARGERAGMLAVFDLINVMAKQELAAEQGEGEVKHFEVFGKRPLFTPRGGIWTG